MRYTVLFHPGSYGTYLSWAIYTYSELNLSGQLDSPFEKFGNAHLYRNNEGYNIVKPVHYDQNIKREKNIILVTPDSNRFLEYLNNQLQKNFHNNFEDFATQAAPPDYKKVIQNQWDTKDITVWQKREYISFFIDNMFKINKEYYDQLFHKEYSNLIELSDNNIIKISANEILFDFKNLIHKILNFYNLQPIETIDELGIIHQEYLNKQNNINKDQITFDIVNSAITNTEHKIQNLTLLDEAWIQHLLRQQGYEIKCYQLDKFPDCSIELHKLLEKI